MRCRSDGETVDPHEVLDADELRDYYRQHPPRPTTGYEALSLGADPAVVAWEQAMENAR